MEGSRARDQHPDELHDDRPKGQKLEISQVTYSDVTLTDTTNNIPAPRLRPPVNGVMR